MVVRNAATRLRQHIPLASSLLLNCLAENYELVSWWYASIYIYIDIDICRWIAEACAESLVFTLVSVTRVLDCNGTAILYVPESTPHNVHDTESCHI